MSAALIGSGLGLALSAAYLAGGMSRAAAEHARAERLARGAVWVARYSQGADGQDPQLLAQRLRGEQGLDPFAQRQLQAARDLDCMTDAVYFEARGETRRGQQAVATVVMNRVKNPSFPKTVCGVVFQRASGGCQFSFACDGSMRHGRDADAWADARRVAARALSGYVLRDIGSATHFHAVGVSPDWGAQMLRVAQVGLHIFYRSNPHAPAQDAPPTLPKSEPVVFTSAPAQPQPTLRIAAALVQKPADPAPLAPAPAASAKPPAPGSKVAASPTRPALVKPLPAPPAGLTRTAAPDAPVPTETTAS